MSKKKIIALICLSIIISWGLVSLNYYNKHVVTVKEYNVGKKIEVSEGIVIIRNIEIHNYERRHFNFDRHEWFYNSFLLKIPVKLQQPAVTVKSFYSERYNSDLGTDDTEGRIMCINGIYVDTKEKDLSNDNRDYFKAYVYTEYGRNLTFGSSGSTSTDGSNIRLFNSRDQFFLNEYAPSSSDSLIISVQDKLSNENHEIIIEPEWETKKYNYFNNPPGDLSFSPDKVVDRFISDVVFNEDLSTAKKLIHPQINDFPWENLEHNEWSRRQGLVTKYIGRYLEFDDVFATRIAFRGSNDAIENNDFQQIIYMVDYDGEWKVINVSHLIAE